MKNNHFKIAFAFCLTPFLAAAAKAQTQPSYVAKVHFSSEFYPKDIRWFTSPWDESKIRYKLQQQPDMPVTRIESDNMPTILIDPAKSYQTITGIGTSLDESACYAMQKNHTDEQIKDILRQIIDPANGIGMNLFRICFGTSDFSDARSVSSTPNGWYSYQDSRDGEFSIKNDQTLGIIRVLKLAQEVAQESGTDIRFFGSAWSPPGWMKDSGSMVGGKLLPAMNHEYAVYLRKSVQAYENAGIPIYAITTNNEHYFAPDKYPGCFFDFKEEALLSEEIGKEFRDSSLKTKLWILDHNYSIWKQASKTLDYLKANTPHGEGYDFVDAVAFHHYQGTPEQMSKLHEIHPDKNIEFSEGSVWGTAGIAEVAENFRNWSKSYTYWVPMVTHTTREHIQGPYNSPGILSPTMFLTKDDNGSDWYKTPEYYLLGQVSRFARPGAVRLDSNEAEDLKLTNVAFRNPDNSIVLIVVNQNEWKQSFRAIIGANQIAATVPAGSVATYQLPGDMGVSTLAPVPPPTVPGPQALPTATVISPRNGGLTLKKGSRDCPMIPAFLLNQPERGFLQVCAKAMAWRK